MKKAANRRRYYLFQSAFRLGVSLVILVLLNFIAGNYYQRFDLTKEKRYTLSETSKQMLANLEDKVLVKVYLAGSLPSELKELQEATEEMLIEFGVYSNGKVEYVFENPNDIKDPDQRQQFIKRLYDKGLQFTTINISEEGGMTEKLVCPGALVVYRGKEIPVTLLENTAEQNIQRSVASSINLLEYKLISRLNILTRSRHPKVAFTEGHGELPDRNLESIGGALAELNYQVERINLKNTVPFTKDYDLLVLPRPTEPFREQEKFKIDQFIMNGGSVLWLVDPVNMSMDSMQGKKAYMATSYQLNLQDQLFRYGAKLVPSLVQDMDCNPIQLTVGYLGNQPQMKPFPWYYYNKASSTNKHPITKNMDKVAMYFSSKVDTTGRPIPGVKRTALLQTSQYSKALLAPVRVHFSMLKEDPSPSAFPEEHLPLAMLMEGQFPSVFENRIATEFVQQYEQIDGADPVKYKSDYAKMIVVGDGDVIANDISPAGRATEVGYHRDNNQTFANKDFLLNCIDYLTSDVNVIETRNKEIRWRELDRQRINQESLFWQLLNVGLPALVMILFGLGYNVVRNILYKRRKA